MPETVPWQVLGMVAASAVFWMTYIDSKDRFRPEPPFRLIGAFAVGMAAAVFAYGAFALLFLAAHTDFAHQSRVGQLLLRVLDPQTAGDTALLCFGLIGPIEEGAKVLGAWFLVFRWRVFDEPIDGFVYAAAIALGFASLENVLHLPDLGLRDQLARTLTLPLTHTLFAAVWGFGIAHARLRMVPGFKFWAVQVGSVILAAAFHGLYDFFLLAWEWTLASSGLVLVLWIAVIWRSHGLVKVQRQRALAITGKHSPVSITGVHPPVAP